MALETFEIISSPPIFKLQGSQKKKRKTKGGGHEKIFEEIVVESFPNMEKEIKDFNQVQKAQSPIQDKLIEKHAKTHTNQTNKD